MVIALVGVLSGISITLLALSWLGRWRAVQQGRLLARGFRNELVRRGLLMSLVLRT
jgi:hypothetical protein